MTLASPPGIKPWSLRSVEGVLDDGSSAAWSLGRLFGSKEVLIGERGYQKAAAGEGHQLGHLFWFEDMGHTLLVFIGTPVIEWSLVMDRSGLGQQVDGVDLGAGLEVSSLKLCDMVWTPKGSFHVRKGLGFLQLGPNLVMQKGNLVVCLIVCLEKVSGLKLEGLEKVIGGLFWPFHQVQIVMDVWAVCMDQALGGEACQVLWWAFGLDQKALFWT